MRVYGRGGRRRVAGVAGLALTLMLTSCGGERPAPRPRNSAPITLSSEPSRETRQCFADLSGANVRYSPLPDRDFGGGCILTGTVQLIDFGVPTTNLKAMTCPLSRTFVAWARYGVVPAGREILGSPVVRIETFGTYSCRGIIGGGGATAGKLSEHAHANAVDVSAFVLADGRRIAIEQDWRNPDPAVRDFLQIVRASACKRFRTVLSPDYNAAHYNHLHFDMGGRPFCR
ncbi:extensin family protein [Sphingomonas cannabina]|uniref:extensin family protein n=1 Tax=Sphingomonas cannabina TaxID=2899123 RepID=UPI001F1B1C83|nr:extensin family protein [Sphingomonas cannabina]UIJ45772.1 extensin family protein [Sphingomonas cannabina]